MKKRAMPLLLSMLLCIGSNFAFGQERTVSGTVKDETGQGLPGATVSEKGTTKKVLTDINGNFIIKVRSKATLVISFIGFAPKEVESGEQDLMSITMHAGTT